MKPYKFALCALTALAAVSCSKAVGDASSANGLVRFAVESDDVIALVTKSNVSDFTALPAAGTFTITVKASDNSTFWTGTLSDWDAAAAMPAGNYTVEASFGQEGVEGFDKPYFRGSASFAVTGGQAAEVTIPVTLANTLVRIVCSDAFKNYYPEYSFKINTGSGNEIDFARTESRAAFVDAYKFTVSGSLTSQGGNARSFEREYASLEAKTCYTLGFDVSNVGSVSVSITFNDAPAEEVALEDVELND